MRFITIIYYTLEGKHVMIPFITDVDQSLKTHKQCIEASEIGQKLMSTHVPKNAKQARYRTFEEGAVSFDLS